MEYSKEVADYFEKKGVSVILLLRRNVLKRLISILANAYDRRAKPLNGTHKSHVHSTEEVCPYYFCADTIVSIQELLQSLDIHGFP